jgi:hypothetical protein
MVHDPSKHDSEGWEDRYREVMHAAEAVLGRERFGGCWIDGSSAEHPSTWIANVTASRQPGWPKGHTLAGDLPYPGRPI